MLVAIRAGCPRTHLAARFSFHCRAKVIPPLRRPCSIGLCNCSWTFLPVLAVRARLLSLPGTLLFDLTTHHWISDELELRCSAPIPRLGKPRATVSSAPTGMDLFACICKSRVFTNRLPLEPLTGT